MEVQKFQRYEHSIEGKKIDLDSYPETPMGYAVQRAKQYSSNPILLVINASKVDSNLELTPCKVCDYLNIEWYRILNIQLENGKVSLKIFEELKNLEKEVLKL
jgi:hypothetical protein